MSESKSIDEKKLNSFMDKIFNDLSGSYTTLLCIIGDRLDLFKKLEKYGPITSQGFAQKSTKPLNSNTAHKISNCVNTNNSNLHISIYRISVIRCVKNCTCSGTFTQ